MGKGSNYSQILMLNLFSIHFSGTPYLQRISWILCVLRNTGLPFYFLCCPVLLSILNLYPVHLDFPLMLLFCHWSHSSVWLMSVLGQCLSKLSFYMIKGAIYFLYETSLFWVRNLGFLSKCYQQDLYPRKQEHFFFPVMVPIILL